MSSVAVLVPGLSITIAIAALAIGVRAAVDVVAISPLVYALVIGIAARAVLGRPRPFQPGIDLALKPVLRLAIVLLGFQITLGEVAELGPRVLIAVALTVVATFFFTKAAARMLGVERPLGELIAAGTSICGASAVVACNTVTRGSDEDVAYALACVTLFGTVSMIGLPLLAGPLGLASETYGVWVGASIHEVAQVVAAAFAESESAGHAGTVAKLSRVLLLAPLILLLKFSRCGAGASGPSTPAPLFVFGFLVAVIVNSVADLPEPFTEAISAATAFMLTVALAAMGLETDLGELRRKGPRPLALGVLATLFITSLGLVSVLWATG